jgi:periplasmic protein TonB
MDAVFSSVWRELSTHSSDDPFHLTPLQEPPTLAEITRATGKNLGVRLMVRAAPRAYTPRTGRFLLLSVLVHLLVIVALSLPLRPWELVSRAPKEEKGEPILVTFMRPENREEPETAEVFAETSSRAQTPEGPKDEVSRANKTILPQEQQPPAEPPPPPIAQMPEPVQPQVPPPPIQTPPKRAPEAPAKRAPAPPRRQEPTKPVHQAPAKPQRPPAEPAEPKRLAKAPEPVEPTPSRAEPEAIPAERAEPRRLARLLEPTESLSGQLPQESAAPAQPSANSLPTPEQRALPRFGRIPLLSGEDLDKYAQVRSSGQQSSSGEGVSLDTKEIKYLSYFAHIKRRIEQVWTYPPGAIANGLQGQLHLKFVLRNDGQVKTVELLRSSGYKVLDKEAWDAVVNGGPFGPFPPTIPDDELQITARFTYVLDETAQRMRMR